MVSRPHAAGHAARAGQVLSGTVGRPASTHLQGEDAMYIGLGTALLVIILLVVLL
jgi:hypothetical protein